MGSIPGWGTKIPHAVCPKNKIKQLRKIIHLQVEPHKKLCQIRRLLGEQGTHYNIVIKTQT